MLSDVVNHEIRYRAILVYDVSRWGRFQDNDEAATYEFLCKTAGAPVHYCAEPFSNDSSVANSIMKALKRTMAAEFSRELGVKCYDGEKRLVQLGFKMGGLPGYGLRRVLLSRNGKRIRVLRKGEWKSVTNERVILAPGPNCEIRVVRLIYELLLSGMRPASIRRELNRRKISFIGDRPWNYWTVLAILRNPKYAGCNVWGQSSRKLHERCKNIPRTQWIIVPGAFTPIVDPEVYERAQTILDDRTINKSDAELLQRLKYLLRKKKYLSQELIDKSRLVPALNTYYRRFGSLRNVYRLIGYQQWDEYFVRRDKAVKTTRLREKFIDQIVSIFPGKVTTRKRPSKLRRLLVVDGTIEVAVYFCRSCHWPDGRRCWRFDPVAGETDNVSLVCALTPANDGVESMYLFRSLGRSSNHKFGEKSRWTKSAVSLKTLAEFHKAVTVLAVQSTS